MRHFKFRAWDKKKKEMFPVHHLEFHKISNQVVSAIGYDQLDSDGWTMHGGHNNKYANGDRYILMQFTGLRDKNGREIYEGDILKHRYYEEPQQVTFSDRFVTYMLQPADVFIQKVDEDRALIEIIGNIYENPELISQ